MKTGTITSAQIASCCLHRMDADHWIPEHKLEECDPVLREKFKLKQEELMTERCDAILAARQKFKRESRLYAEQLRDSKNALILTEAPCLSTTTN